MAIFVEAKILVTHKITAGALDRDRAAAEEEEGLRSFKDFCDALVEVADHTEYGASVQYLEVYDR